MEMWGRGEGSGEVRRDKGSYAAEGQLLVVEWMTNRLSAAKGWRYSSSAAQLKKYGPLHMHAHKCAQKQSSP